MLKVLGGEVWGRTATEEGELGVYHQRREARHSLGLSAAPDSVEHCERAV